MRYTAVKTFAGAVSMKAGETRELSEQTAADLLHCGYVIAAETKGEEKNEAKRSNARQRKAGNAH